MGIYIADCWEPIQLRNDTNIMFMFSLDVEQHMQKLKSWGYRTLMVKPYGCCNQDQCSTGNNFFL